MGLLIAVVITGTSGDLLLGHGMKQVAQAVPVDLAHLGSVLLACAHTPYVVIGIACMALYFGLYLTALSWADLSLVLPFTALGFVLVALFAQVVLHEHVSLLRWTGVAAIVTGVWYVAHS